MLTQREAVFYMLQRDLLSPEQVVTGGLTVADISRRHYNYQITARQGPGYVLKQGVGPDKVTAIEREAAMYQLLNRFKQLSPYLPRLYAHDAENPVLILELIEGSQNLREYHGEGGHFSISLARQLGNALGTLHRSTEARKDLEGEMYLAAGRPPWVLSVPLPAIKFIQECSSANLQLIQIVQQFPVFCKLLDALRQEWRTEAIIHHDIRWDNCMVLGKSPLARKSRLKIIDWELAGLGDPCWDVGAVFNEYLSFWLLSIPVTGEIPADRFLQLARYPLEKMQPAILSFWQSYVQQMCLDVATVDRWLLQAVRYGAARLVQTAFEQMQLSIQLTGNVVCLLQLSLNILQRPHEAAVQLLGIPLGGVELP